MEVDNVVAKEPKNPDVITEGKAEILLLEKNVFYNPVQEFNRDLRYAFFLFYMCQNRIEKRRTNYVYKN